MRVIFAFILAVCCISIPLPAAAQQVDLTLGEKINQVMFLIDCSGSMNAQDTDNLVAETIKMLVDSLPSEHTEIGFVAYTDVIVRTYPLTSIESSESRTAIKEAVDGLVRKGETDIGLALKQGMEILKQSQNNKSKPVMLLFSDGATELVYSHTGRVSEDSLRDEASALATAGILECPVYTLGISHDGSLNTDYLVAMAEATSGKNYAIRNTNALPAIFRDLLSDITGLEVIQETITVQGDGIQPVTLAAWGSYSEEINIIFQYDPGAVESLICLDENAAVFLSRRYGGVKVQSPDQMEIAFNLTGTSGHAVSINTINYIHIAPGIKLPDNNRAAREVPVSATIFNDDAPEAAALYDGLSAMLSVGGMDEIIPMERTEAGFTCIYKNRIPAEIDLTVTVTDERENRIKFEMNNLVLTNNPPVVQSGGEKIPLPLTKAADNEYNLSEYFTDVDGDTIAYSLDQDSEAFGASLIENDVLRISPTATQGEISILAEDERGGRTQLVFDAKIPFVLLYKTPLATGAALLMILAAAGTFLIISKKRPVTNITLSEPPATRFSGARFEGYFLSTLSGNEIPVLNWNAGSIEQKNKISLGELFRNLDVTEKLPEADRIFFEAGNNSTLIFHHETECIVGLGNRDIPRNKKAVLNFDDRLYITFEDHMTEIEVRYKRARKLG